MVTIMYRISSHLGSLWYSPNSRWRGEGTYLDFLNHIDMVIKTMKDTNGYKDPKLEEICIWGDKNQESGWLHTIPDSVITIKIENCNIGKLPKLPNNLKWLIVYNTDIEEFSCLPYGLEYLNCRNNDKLKHIPLLPPSIINYNGPYEKVMIKITKIIYRKIANKIGEWFLDCKYNPKYKYCRDRLATEHRELYNN